MLSPEGGGLCSAILILLWLRSVLRTRRLHTSLNYERCASSDPLIAARGRAESVGDSRQFGNGFRLDLQNSVIKLRIAPRR